MRRYRFQFCWFHSGAARWYNRAAEAGRARTDESVLVPVAKIRGNNYDLSINRYKEVGHEQKLFDSHFQAA